jgi:hypothetical protein
VRDNPQTDAEGIADYGYEEPNIESFRSEFGVDPHEVQNADARWISCRAEPITEFLRQARKVLNDRRKRLPLSAMVYHPWAYRGVLPGMAGYEKWKKMGGNLIDGSMRGILCDIKTWALEHLVDQMVATGYYRGEGTPEKAYGWLKEETEGHMPLWLYCWVPNKAQDLHRDLALAEKLGTRQMLFWEADYIDMRQEPQREEIRKAMSGYVEDSQ